MRFIFMCIVLFALSFTIGFLLGRTTSLINRPPKAKGFKDNKPVGQMERIENDLIEKSKETNTPEMDDKVLNPDNETFHSNQGWG